MAAGPETFRRTGTAARQRSRLARLALLAGFAAFPACSSAPLPSPGWESAAPEILASPAAAGPLRAGAAAIALDPPYAVPMAGYLGASFLDLRRLRDPLHARALVLECDRLRFALVAIDRVLVTRALRTAVEAHPAFRAAGIREWIPAATHTHTAPGAHLESWPAELFGTGDFDPLIFEHLADGIARAVAQAAGALEPCALDHAGADPSASGTAWISFNRRDPAAAPDRSLDLVRFARLGAGPGGAPPGSAIARWFRFPAHPTLIPFYLRSASGDYPGIACRLIEADQGGIALFASGPSADLAAGHPDDVAAVGWERRLERIGRRLAGEAARLEETLASAPPEAKNAIPLSFAHIRMRLPPRRPWSVPFAGRAIASHYPEFGTFACLRAGDVLILSFPGEISEALGASIEEAARAATGARRALIASLAGDYLGYAFTREEQARGGKSAHLTVYGDELEDAARKAMVAAARGAWEAGEEATRARHAAGGS